VTARRAILAAAAVAALAATGAACAPLPSGDSGIPLRVMTYNIRSGNGNLVGIGSAIRQLEPDIAALQEVDVRWHERSNFVDEAAALGRELGMQVRFAPIYSLPSLAGGGGPREFGVALLSRYPIVAFSNDSIARLSTQEQNPVPALAPGLLHVTLDVHGRRVRVFNTHLDYRKEPAVRERQVREMLSHLGSLDTPTLVFGDMNAGPSAPELQPLLARLHDAWSGSAGAGFTYPADRPTERIDYVLLSPQFSVTSTRVPVTEASDHRPVVADLILR
jgi:endonuclease/exonuclease/phosphatase family metal-dependent hydrolase